MSWETYDDIPKLPTEPLVSVPQEIKPDEYLTHLHDERWEIIRVTTGKGIEISDHDFVVLPKAIKIVYEDNPVLFKDYMRFKVADFTKLDEIENGTLNFIFVTERHQKYITPEAMENWKQKLKKKNSYLILHRKVGDSYKFEVFWYDYLTDNLENWYFPTFPEKNVAVIRYGAFGDMLQASSVVAGLKKQGYHVSLYCSPPGSEVIKHDPNIDEIVIQDKDQVRNHELGHYWNWLKKKHHKFVNLCESVERTWLARKGDSAFEWSFPVRNKYLNVNYLQFQHELAGVPHNPKVKFYPTEEELKWAETERKYMNGKKIIMWAMAGSSVHKVFPYMDEFIATMMLLFKDVDIVLVGGDDTEILQGGWQNEPRVHRRAGQWNIRQTMTFAQTQCDLIIGPETGVLNAMCCEPVEKIVFLSHSTHINLTRDWIRTKALSAPKKALEECGHCCLHRLHYNWDDVKRDEETGVAWCQSKIDRDELFYTAIEKLGIKVKKNVKRTHY